jgi:hypothetical protein
VVDEIPLTSRVLEPGSDGAVADTLPSRELDLDPRKTRPLAGPMLNRVVVRTWEGESCKGSDEVAEVPTDIGFLLLSDHFDLQRVR